MPEPALYTNQLRAGTGDAFVVGQSQSLQQGRHERDVMRNLDVQEMKSRAMQQAKAAAQQDALEKELLKLDTHDVGRFHPFYSEYLVNPTMQRVVKINPKAPNARSLHFLEAQNLNNAGLTLKNANDMIDLSLGNLEKTRPGEYDLAEIDRAVTAKATDYLKKGNKLGPAEIQGLIDETIQEYPSINRNKVYQNFIKQTEGKKNKISINTDPSGSNRTRQEIEAHPYFDIIPQKKKNGDYVRDINGNVLYKTRFAGDRVFKDHLANPQTALLYREQKASQLKDPGLKSQYEADLIETGQTQNPAAKQRAYDELEYKYFIEPFMPGKDSWATRDMTAEQIKQFREQKSLTESEREAEKSRQIVNVGVRPVVKEKVQGGSGNRTGTEYVQQVSLTKEQANKLALDATNTTFLTQGKDGILKQAKGIILDQGISPDVNIVHRTYFNKNQGINVVNAQGQMVKIPKGVLSPGIERLMGQNGLFGGGEFNKEYVDAAIKQLKAKGYTPAVFNQSGKPYKIENADDLAHVNVLGSSDFFEITPLRQQAEKNKGISLSKNNETGTTAMRIMNLGIPSRLYIPVNSTTPLKGIVQGNLGDQAFTEMLQRGSFAQDDATMKSLLGEVKKAAPTQPAATTQKKIKIK